MHGEFISQCCHLIDTKLITIVYISLHSNGGSYCQNEYVVNCEKCTGTSACKGVDQSKIGCGSCQGYQACSGLASGVTIGEQSCLGDWTCNVAKGEMNIVWLEI